MSSCEFFFPFGSSVFHFSFSIFPFFPLQTLLLRGERSSRPSNKKAWRFPYPENRRGLSDECGLAGDTGTDNVARSTSLDGLNVEWIFSLLVYTSSQPSSLFMTSLTKLSLRPASPTQCSTREDRPCGIPRPRHDIFIPLQPNQPPRTATHDKGRAQAADDEPQQASRHDVPDPAPAKATRAVRVRVAFRQNETHSAGRKGNEDGGEKDMAGPGFVPEVAAKDGKEAEDFDAEEGQ